LGVEGQDLLGQVVHSHFDVLGKILHHVVAAGVEGLGFMGFGLRREGRRICCRRSGTVRSLVNYLSLWEYVFLGLFLELQILDNYRIFSLGFIQLKFFYQQETQKYNCRRFSTPPARFRPQIFSRKPPGPGFAT
jgi:hypothetical protein